MTSSTSTSDFGSVTLMDLRSTAAQSFGGPATLLLSTLLAVSIANADHVKVAELIPSSNSSLQLTKMVHRGLFDDLLAFHQRLASSQQDLPEEAARLLRENLWQLYG